MSLLHWQPEPPRGGSDNQPLFTHRAGGYNDFQQNDNQNEIAADGNHADRTRCGRIARDCRCRAGANERRSGAATHSTVCAAQNDGNLDVYDELLTPGFVRHSSSDDDVRGSQAYKQFMQDHLKVFPDFNADVQTVVVEGNMVAVRASVSGTQRAALGKWPATGKQFETNLTAFFRLDRGRISELWVEVNTHDMLKQLGHIN